MEILLTVLLPETFRNSSEAHGELQVYVYRSFFYIINLSYVQSLFFWVKCHQEIFSP
jgi:hypothetical protein